MTVILNPILPFAQNLPGPIYVKIEDNICEKLNSQISIGDDIFVYSQKHILQ